MEELTLQQFIDICRNTATFFDFGTNLQEYGQDEVPELKQIIQGEEDSSGYVIDGVCIFTMDNYNYTVKRLANDWLYTELDLVDNIIEHYVNDPLFIEDVVNNKYPDVTKKVTDFYDSEATTYNGKEYMVVEV